MITTHPSSFSTQLGKKYFESSSKAAILEAIAQMPEEDYQRLLNFQEEHLENHGPDEDWSDRESDVNVEK